MTRSATSKAEADADIEKLRQERGFSGQELQESALVSSLQNALDMQVP